MSYVICVYCGSHSERHPYSQCPNEWCESRSHEDEESEDDEES